MGKYWEPKWREKVSAESEHSLDDFRSRTNPLHRGIITLGITAEAIDSFWGKHLKPPEMRDSLVGKPEHIQIPNGKGGSVPVSRSSVEHAFMAKTAAEYLPFRPERVRALEIGGGFGGLTWSLYLQILERRGLPFSCDFVDHPIHLKVQRYFSDRAMASVNRRFLTPQQFMNSAINGPREKYDLVTCTRAFGEMDLAEALGYCTVLPWCVKPGGIVYLVTWRQKVIRVEDLRFSEAAWELLLDEPWPPDVKDGHPMVARVYRRRGNA